MTAPAWVTPPGNLGTVVEGEFYTIQLDATYAYSYKYLSGVLPDGIRVSTNGVVEGNPRNYNYIAGVPVEVAQNVTSKFVVRATSSDGRVADRVFEMTITGQDAPTIQSLPPSALPSYFDGSYVESQLTAFDPDPADVLTWKVQSGEVPTGLTLSADGLLSGWLLPVPTLIGTPGFDVNSYDVGNFDFSTISVSKYYKFTVEVTDGKDVANKTYTMFVASRNLVSADSTDVTADIFAPTVDADDVGSQITADITSKRTPYLVTKAVDLGTIKHDNYFNFQFTGYDFDGEPIEYSISTGDALGYDSDSATFDAFGFDRGKQELPPGLVLNTSSGWMYGYVPGQTAITNDYKFAIRVYKKDDPTYQSDWTNFTLKVEGDIDSSITWPVVDLGTIETGQVSELNVIATIGSGASVQYSLKSGADLGAGGKGELPQGLRIDSNGLIVGRVSFETFMMDTGTTTFDYDSVRVNETTFERIYTFSVKALSSNGVIDTYKQFTIKVVPKIFKPYESVYIKALPSQSQRDIYENLINNADDIAPENIYRATDSNFGVQKTIRALVAAGLNPVTETDLVEATAQNHWNNTLGFGAIKIAKAYNEDGTEKYDVVYIELVDKAMGVNPSTGVVEPATQKIDLKVQKSLTQMTDWSNPLRIDAGWPKVSSGNYATDADNDHYVYPNAIQNMRNQLTVNVGTAILERFVLPDWMKDKQSGGSVIGWTLAAPVVYCKPGTGSKVAYLLEQRTLDLKKISFEVDRYILDNNLSQFYNKATGKWTLTPETTFDVHSYVSNADIAAGLAATVNYSASGEFNMIAGASASEVIANNRITGLTDVADIDGKTMIFLNHDDSLNWFNVVAGNKFDESGFDSSPLEHTEFITGWTEKFIGLTTINKRAGVWTLGVDAWDFVTLTFTTEIDNGQKVKVTYDNITYYYERNPSSGLIPKYVNVNTVELLVLESATTFDGNDTRFFASVDKFIELDAGDKYIKFPQVGVFR